MFAILHLLLYQANIIHEAMFEIWRDNGYSETFQYIKLFWIAILFFRRDKNSFNQYSLELSIPLPVDR